MKNKITVIPADEFGNYFLADFFIEERFGFEVYKVTKEMELSLLTRKITEEQLLDDTIWPFDKDKNDYVYHIPLKREDDLKNGDRVIINYMGNYVFGTVEDGRAKIDGSKCFAALSFCSDDRECWTCGCVYNLDAINKISLTEENSASPA